MTTRYDLLTVREDKNGTARFTKLGAMFPNQKGDGFNIVLDGVPASVDGQYRLIAKVPQERDGGNQPRQQQGRSRFGDDEQDPPF